MIQRSSRLLAALLVIPLLPSCALWKGIREEIRKGQAAKAEPQKQAEPGRPVLFEWNGTEKPGTASVAISLSDQKARIFKNGEPVGWTYVATGTAGHSTPTGTYRIMEKQAEKRSNVWGVIVNSSGSTVDGEARNGRESIPAGGRFVGAPMPHWMRLTGYGIGMHGGPIPRPGQPASHGCIRLPYEMAGILFDHLPVGTPVTITK